MIAATEDVLDGFKLVERIGKGDITVMQATPTLWGMLLEAGLKPAKGLKMLAGGEPLQRDLAEKLTSDGAELWNMYGPTETTIWSAVNQIEPGTKKITIGHPIANTSLHVLDSGDRVQPIGVVGELNIGGDGLAKGYFGREDLTQAAFREVSLAGDTQMLYRTGDLARRLADGTIEVLGRSDGQIKLRGFRIELGEIETAIRAIDGVEKAAVDLRSNANGDKQLVGYVVAKSGDDPQPQDVAAALTGKLPGYMVPSAWVMLSELPQTLNGKLNRKALPAPEAAATVTPLRDIKEPTTELERKLAGIWQEVLGIEKIGTSETLFMLGADSLSVFRIAARMLDEGLNLEGRHLLQHPSIGELAAFAESRSDTPAVARPSLKSFRGGARRGQEKAS